MIILPPQPVNVVPPPAFVPQQPQGPRFGGLPAFHNPFAVLQQQQYDDNDDDNDDTLYENLDEMVVQQPQPSGTKTKPPFPAPRTTLSKTLSSSSSEGNRLQSGFHTCDEGTATETETEMDVDDVDNIDDVATPDADFQHEAAKERRERELAKAELRHQQERRDAETVRRDFGELSSRETRSSGHNLDESILHKYLPFRKAKK